MPITLRLLGAYPARLGVLPSLSASPILSAYVWTRVHFLSSI